MPKHVGGQIVRMYFICLYVQITGFLIIIIALNLDLFVFLRDQPNHSIINTENVIRYLDVKLKNTFSLLAKRKKKTFCIQYIKYSNT